VAIGSTLISGSGSLGEIALELLKLLVLFVLMAHLLNSEKRVHGAMVALVLFTAVLGARTIWRFQHGEALAMAMALPMALGIGLGLGRAVAHQGWPARIVSLGCVPIYVWTVFVSDSRGGMLALGTAIFLYFRRRLGRIGLVLGAMAVLVLFAFGPARMSNMSADEESAAGRVDAWVAGIHMLISSPVWGVGKGQFTEHNHLTAHNSFVLCFAELGILGAMAWMGLFYFVFRDGKIMARHGQPNATGPLKGARPTPWSRSALAQISLITFAVGGFFLSRTYTPPLYVYLALALAATHAEAETAGVPLPPATSKDLARVAGLVIGGIVAIWLLVRVLG
jgi:putative inorganic carbon (hco3(-)) transporter